MSTSIRAHFDGRAIVPDEPVPLAPGEALRVTIERDADTKPTPKTGPRQAGSARGQVWMSADFDSPLPEFEELTSGEQE